MTRTPDPRDPPRTADELYECATVTSDLGLPHGDGAGAQGILAAAAWTEVHLGSSLRRMRAQWDAIRPTKKAARPYELLRTTGLTREAARSLHNRERVQNGLTYLAQKRAARMRLREYEEACHQLAMQAVKIGMEDADTTARAVLDRWLDDPEMPPDGMDGRALWMYLRDCLNRARAGLKLGMRGVTNNNAG